MKLLEQVYAGDTSVVIIETVEVRSTGQLSHFLCNGFTEQGLYVNELSRYITFKPSNIAVKQMDRDNRASQSAQIVLDNVLGDVQLFVDKAAENGRKIELFMRLYLSDDKSKQASNTIKATAKKIAIQATEVQISAGFFDTLNTNFNRITYNSDTAPCIRYM